MAFEHGENQDTVWNCSLHDAIRAQEHFPYVVAPELRNDTARVRCCRNILRALP